MTPIGEVCRRAVRVVAVALGQELDDYRLSMVGPPGSVFAVQHDGPRQLTAVPVTVGEFRRFLDEVDSLPDEIVGTVDRTLMHPFYDRLPHGYLDRSDLPDHVRQLVVCSCLRRLERHPPPHIVGVGDCRALVGRACPAVGRHPEDGQDPRCRDRVRTRPRRLHRMAGGHAQRADCTGKCPAIAARGRERRTGGRARSRRQRVGMDGHGAERLSGYRRRLIRQPAASVHALLTCLRARRRPEQRGRIPDGGVVSPRQLRASVTGKLQQGGGQLGQASLYQLTLSDGSQLVCDYVESHPTDFVRSTPATTCGACGARNRRDGRRTWSPFATVHRWASWV